MIRLDAHIRFDVIFQDLDAAGYTDLEVVERRDSRGRLYTPASNVVLATHPDGTIVRLESLEDVALAIALDTEEIR